MKKVFNAYWCDDYSVYAAETKEEAAQCYFEDTGEHCVGEYPYQCSDDLVDKLVEGYDVNERPTGKKTSMRKWLKQTKSSGWLCGTE